MAAEKKVAKAQATTTAPAGSILDEIVEQVVRSLEFSVLAKYAFALAQGFNAYYNLDPSRSSILNEERPDVRRWRAAGAPSTPRS